MKSWLIQLMLVISALCSVGAFSLNPQRTASRVSFQRSAAASDDADPKEIIARKVVLNGDVTGGYYRSCVKNEATRFRKLSGTMSPPDGSKEAEIYVEGTRKQVESFIRWCKRSDVGLSQVIKVTNVLDEEPTGLYDDFYVQTKE